MINTFTINSIEELNEVADKIIATTNKHSIILFDAPMGAGKTTLISTICSKLEVNENISSPTYAIYNEYFSELVGTIYHFDCYRLKDEFEALDSGIEEIIDSGQICLIEWPNKIEKLLPNNCVKVSIKLNNEQRIISIEYEN